MFGMGQVPFMFVTVSLKGNPSKAHTRVSEMEKPQLWEAYSSVLHGLLWTVSLQHLRTAFTSHLGFWTHGWKSSWVCPLFSGGPPKKLWLSFGLLAPVGAGAPSRAIRGFGPAEVGESELLSWLYLVWRESQKENRRRGVPGLVWGPRFSFWFGRKTNKNTTGLLVLRGPRRSPRSSTRMKHGWSWVCVSFEARYQGKQKAKQSHLGRSDA